MRLQAGWDRQSDDPRKLVPISLADTSIQIEVMMYRGEASERAPLVIINSIEFPIPPSIEFCEKMWASGYQVIFCRRPGFGPLPGLPASLMSRREVKNRAAIAAESALFRLLIQTLELKNVTLLGLGTGNSICYRLAQLSPEISYTIYANPLFHPDIWDVIRPTWLMRMIRQTLLSQSGLKIAVRGLKAVLRRDPIWFYRQFGQKSEGDLAYLANHENDFKRAGVALQRLSPETFFYDLQTALIEDTKWDPEVTARSDAMILAGVETTPRFKKSIAREAERLKLPIKFAKSGDLFVPYASPDTLLEILNAHAKRATKQAV
ncbi:MAG: hypothetical protein AAGJ68_04775 [Pseudomonadota bacterium]